MKDEDLCCNSSASPRRRSSRFPDKSPHGRSCRDLPPQGRAEFRQRHEDDVFPFPDEENDDVSCY